MTSHHHGTGHQVSCASARMLPNGREQLSSSGTLHAHTRGDNQLHQTSFLQLHSQVLVTGLCMQALTLQTACIIQLIRHDKRPQTFTLSDAALTTCSSGKCQSVLAAALLDL